MTWFDDGGNRPPHEPPAHTMEDVIAFDTYTDAAKFAAIRPDNRSKPWRCPIQRRVYS